ncbi:MAG TPA: hypothetical protein VGN16_16425 [Acidobacteriaceae bacterium]|jgi:hypothetical protein
MQVIWRKNFELLRRDPALWWPALLANVCSFGLQNLQKVVHFQLVRWMMTGRRSVLGGPPLLVEQPLAKLVVINGIVDVFLNYLSILMFCMALAVVAAKVRRVLAAKIDPIEITVPGETFQGIVRFSFVSTICILCTGALTLSLPAYVLFRWLDRFQQTHQALSAPVMSLPFYVLLGYVLSPFALAFLEQKKFSDVARLQRKEGRIASLLSALALLAIVIVLNEMPIPDSPSYAVRLMRDGMLSLLGTLPYVALFVALSVIAFGSNPEAESLPPDMPVPAE